MSQRDFISGKINGLIQTAKSVAADVLEITKAFDFYDSEIEKQYQNVQKEINNFDDLLEKKNKEKPYKII